MTTIVDKNKNLEHIRRFDAFASEVIEHCAHAALFNFSLEKNKWLKTEVDGPLFIYKRVDEPLYSLMIVNRQSPKNFVEPITDGLQLRYESPYIFIHRHDGCIRGVWVYGEDDCKRMFNTLSRLCKQSSEDKQSNVSRLCKQSSMSRLCKQSKEDKQFNESEKFNETKQSSEDKQFNESEKFNETKQFNESEKFNETKQSSEDEQFNEGQQSNETKQSSEDKQFNENEQSDEINQSSETKQSSEDKQFNEDEQSIETKQSSEDNQSNEDDQSGETKQSSNGKPFNKVDNIVSVSPPPYQDVGALLRPVTFGDLERLKRELMDGFRQMLTTELNKMMDAR